MKIKLYIVTYKKNDVLNKNLESLFRCTNNMKNVEVTVLANHPEVVINRRKIRKNIRLVINNTRALNSWGYLSRDWNWCLLDCFKTWENPDSVDWCVLAQNDVEWVKGWDSWLVREKRFDMITQPRGDQCMALNIEAVKRVGFFDERFTTVHCQESDYFIRAIKRLNSRVSINDTHVGLDMNYNPVGEVLTKESFSGVDESGNQCFHNSIDCEPSINLRKAKWAGETFHEKSLVTYSDECSAREVNWYPFFWVGFDEIKETFLEEYGLKSGGSNV